MTDSIAGAYPFAPVKEQGRDGYLEQINDCSRTSLHNSVAIEQPIPGLLDPENPGSSFDNHPPGSRSMEKAASEGKWRPSARPVAPSLLTQALRIQVENEAQSQKPKNKVYMFRPLADPAQATGNTCLAVNQAVPSSSTEPLPTGNGRPAGKRCAWEKDPWLADISLSTGHPVPSAGPRTPPFTEDASVPQVSGAASGLPVNVAAGGLPAALCVAPPLYAALGTVLATLSMLAVSVVSYIATLILLRQSARHGAADFPEAVERALGPSARRVAEAAVGSSCWLAAAVYLVVLEDTLAHHRSGLLAPFLPEPPRRGLWLWCSVDICVACAAALSLAHCNWGRFRAYGHAAAGVAAAVAALLAAVATAGLASGRAAPPTWLPAKQQSSAGETVYHAKDMLFVLPCLLLPFTFQHNVIPLRSQVYDACADRGCSRAEEPTLRRSLFWGTVGNFILMCIAGVAGCVVLEETALVDCMILSRSFSERNLEALLGDDDVAAAAKYAMGGLFACLLLVSLPLALLPAEGVLQDAIGRLASPRSIRDPAPGGAEQPLLGYERSRAERPMRRSSAAAARLVAGALLAAGAVATRLCAAGPSPDRQLDAVHLVASLVLAATCYVFPALLALVRRPATPFGSSSSLGSLGGADGPTAAVRPPASPPAWPLKPLEAQLGLWPVARVRPQPAGALWRGPKGAWGRRGEPAAAGLLLLMAFALLAASAGNNALGWAGLRMREYEQ